MADGDEVEAAPELVVERILPIRFLRSREGVVRQRNLVDGSGTLFFTGLIVRI